MSKSVYARLDNIDAEVSKAKALLCSAQTCLEADFYEDGFGEYQGIARYHAGNLQVLLGVIGCTLTQAEEEIYDLNKALHKSKAETAARHPDVGSNHPGDSRTAGR